MKETDSNKVEVDVRDKQSHVVDDAKASKDEEIGHDDKAEALKGKEANGDDVEAGARNKASFIINGTVSKTRKNHCWRASSWKLGKVSEFSGKKFRETNKAHPLPEEGICKELPSRAALDVESRACLHMMKLR